MCSNVGGKNAGRGRYFRIAGYLKGKPVGVTKARWNKFEVIDMKIICLTSFKFNMIAMVNGVWL